MTYKSLSSSITLTPMLRLHLATSSTLNTLHSSQLAPKDIQSLLNGHLIKEAFSNHPLKWTTQCPSLSIPCILHCCSLCHASVPDVMVYIYQLLFPPLLDNMH